MVKTEPWGGGLVSLCYFKNLNITIIVVYLAAFIITLNVVFLAYVQWCPQINANQLMG